MHEPASVQPDPEESNVAMGDGVLGRNFVYVQGNAPPHTARDTAAFLDQQDVEVMDWPARILGMNPIEHVWDRMSVWIRDMDEPPCTVAERNNAVRQAWAAVRPGSVRTLVESMPRLVRTLLIARGGHTRYSRADSCKNRSNYDTNNRFGTDTLWGSLFKKKNRGPRKISIWPPFSKMAAMGYPEMLFFVLEMAVIGQRRLL